MKKRYIAYAILFVCLSFASCRKIYTCTCMVNEEKTMTSFNYEHKKNVKSYCDQMEAAAKIEDPSATCKVEEADNQQP